ncbi:MAG TPA: QsdR family transcriptional regulator [Acidimicrobiales bacterium]
MYRLETALARQLATDRPHRPSALDAFEAARKRFIAGERIEMGALADEIGTTRVTLHRWVGSRDQLLGEVLWSLAEPTLRQARGATRRRGGKGIADAFGHFLQAVHDAPFFRTFLEREPEIALRVLTTKNSALQGHLVETMRDMLAAELTAGRLDPPMGLDDLAYIIIRLGESFMYTDIITGGNPDPDKARRAVLALLR